jgi:hypothetical protein
MFSVLEKEHIVLRFKEIVEQKNLLFDNENEHYKECEDDSFLFMVSTDDDTNNDYEVLFLVDFKNKIWYLSSFSEPPYGHSMYGKPRKFDIESFKEDFELFIKMLFDA